MPRPPLDAVFLDLGNVLVFHDNDLLNRRLSEQAGGAAHPAPVIPEPLWERINRGTLDREGIRREVCAALGVQLSPERFFEVWNCHFEVHRAVLPQVEALAAQVKLVLLSNTNALHFEYLRPQLPVLERFHALVLSFQVGAVKPEPRIFEEALARAGCAPERAAFFDDVADYAQAASRLGLHGRVFTTAAAFARQCEEWGLS